MNFRSLVVATATILALACGVNAAEAQTATGVGVGYGNANAASRSGALAVSGGSSSSVTFNTPSQQSIRYHQSGSLKTTPNAIAPGLGSAAVETCYGPGVSFGVAATGFGISGGAGQYDSACNARLNSRTLFAMGYKAQAIQLLVNEEPSVARAFGYGGAPAVGPVGVRPVAVRGPVAAPVRSAGGCSKYLYGPGSPCVVE